MPWMAWEGMWLINGPVGCVCDVMQGGGEMGPGLVSPNPVKSQKFLFPPDTVGFGQTVATISEMDVPPF